MLTAEEMWPKEATHCQENNGEVNWNWHRIKFNLLFIRCDPFCSYERCWKGHVYKLSRMIQMMREWFCLGFFIEIAGSIFSSGGSLTDNQREHYNKKITDQYNS